MNDNLPEINISKKPEKKRGALGWLRGLGGSGSRGAIGAMGGSSSGAAGLGGLLAGHMSTIIMVALMATAGGLYIAHNSSAPMINPGSFSSNKGADNNYVPGILRSEQANQGSSLAMFTDKNKGSGLSLDENAPAKAAANNAGDKTGDTAAAAAKDEPKSEEAKTPDGQTMAQGIMGQAGGAGSGSLTSSLGGSGSGRISMMGGNKSGQNSMGNGGLSGGVGNGFAAMPKFNERKGKLMAMTGAARPITSASKAAKHANVGKGAWNQSNALHNVQKSAGSGSKADTLRYTQDAAWTGNTAGGATTEGAGLGDGGAGIVTSPSLDNATSSGGGSTAGGSGVSIPECTGSDTECASHEEQPWEKLAHDAEMLIMLAAVLSIAGAALVNVKVPPWIAILGYIVCALAALAAVAALVLGAIIMKDNFLVGTIYCIGGAVAAAGAAEACFGDPTKGAMTTVLWVAAASGVIALIGGMAKT